MTSVDLSRCGARLIHRRHCFPVAVAGATIQGGPKVFPRADDSSQPSSRPFARNYDSYSARSAPLASAFVAVAIVLSSLLLVARAAARPAPDVAKGHSPSAGASVDGSAQTGPLCFSGTITIST